MFDIKPNVLSWILVAMIVLLLTVHVFYHHVLPQRHSWKTTLQKCSPHTCGALDPVNNPEYNVEEAIKQVLLLEQHLAEKAKYCKSCCTKHFLLIEGLLSEAVWMSGTRCAEYPKLEDSVEFFKKLFKEWHGNMDDDKTRVEVLAKLRDWRRMMVDLYYFKDGTSDSHS